MNQPRVTWDADGWAEINGWALAFCANQFGEFMEARDVWVAVGTGLPAGAYLDGPMQPEPGKSIIRKGAVWVQVADYRGQTAYNKQTHHPVLIDTIGELPSELTLTPPATQFDVWDEQQQVWVKDKLAENSWLIDQAQYQRKMLMGEASQEIAALVDALDPAIISDPSDDDQVKLIAWKTYRIELSKIDQQPSYPDTINWPAKPQ